MDGRQAPTEYLAHGLQRICHDVFVDGVVIHFAEGISCLRKEGELIEGDRSAHIRTKHPTVEGDVHFNDRGAPNHSG